MVKLSFSTQRAALAVPLGVQFLYGLMEVNTGMMPIDLLLQELVMKARLRMAGPLKACWDGISDKGKKWVTGGHGMICYKNVERRHAGLPQ